MTRLAVAIRTDLVPARTDIQGVIEFAHDLIVESEQTTETPLTALSATVLGPMLWLAARLDKPELVRWLIELPDTEDLAAFWRVLDLTNHDYANAQQRLMAYLAGDHQQQRTLHAMFTKALQLEVALND